MKIKLSRLLRFATFAGLALLATQTALAQTNVVAPAAPTSDERIAALEAYINNTDPGNFFNF